MRATSMVVAAVMALLFGACGGEVGVEDRSSPASPVAGDQQLTSAACVFPRKPVCDITTGIFYGRGSCAPIGNGHYYVLSGGQSSCYVLITSTATSSCPSTRQVVYPAGVCDPMAGAGTFYPLNSCIPNLKDPYSPGACP